MKKNIVLEPVYVDVDEDAETGEVITDPGEMVRVNEGFDITNRISRPSIVTPEYLEAVFELSTGYVKQEYVEHIPGARGGRNYVSHPHATRTMNAVFRENWEYQCLDYELFPDGSVAARCCMIVRWPDAFAGMRERTFIEIGTFVPQTTASTGEFQMSQSDRVASAVSRGLLKCMFRAFGYAAHLYKDESRPMTKNAAWGTLRRYAIERKGLTEDEVVEALKSNGYTQDNLVERFNEAYDMINNLAKKYKDEEPPLD
jgi:hypothetical protein